MDFDSKSMKQRAKQLMQTTVPSPWMLGIIFGIFAVIYSFVYWMIMINVENGIKIIFFIPVVEIIYLIFRNSCYWYCLKVTREEKTVVNDAFLGFKENVVKGFIVALLRDVCIMLGYCVLFVGLFFPFYWYRLALYIVKDNPEMGIFAALRRSRKLLKEHYVELIKLDVSNLGWIILAVVTLGIANIYVKPYLGIVYAEYYDFIKGQENMFDR